MSSRSTFAGRMAAGWVLGAALAGGLAPATTAGAASLCLATSAPPFSPIVLTNARLKKGKVNAVVGYLPAAGGSLPVSGVSIVSADGTSLAIALEMPRVSVASGGGGSALASETIFRALFVEPDQRLDVGDPSSQGVVGGANATFTVIDCDTAPPIP